MLYPPETCLQKKLHRMFGRYWVPPLHTNIKSHWLVPQSAPGGLMSPCTALRSMNAGGKGQTEVQHTQELHIFSFTFFVFSYQWPVHGISLHIDRIESACRKLTGNRVFRTGTQWSCISAWNSSLWGKLLPSGKNYLQSAETSIS